VGHVNILVGRKASKYKKSLGKVEEINNRKIRGGITTRSSVRYQGRENSRALTDHGLIGSYFQTKNSGRKGDKH